MSKLVILGLVALALMVVISYLLTFLKWSVFLGLIAVAIVVLGFIYRYNKELDDQGS